MTDLCQAQRKYRYLEQAPPFPECGAKWSAVWHLEREEEGLVAGHLLGQEGGMGRANGGSGQGHVGSTASGSVEQTPRPVDSANGDPPAHLPGIIVGELFPDIPVVEWRSESSSPQMARSPGLIAEEEVGVPPPVSIDR